MITRVRPLAVEKTDLVPVFRKMIQEPQYVQQTVVTSPPLEIGHALGDGQKFFLTDAQIAVHMAVLGGSGSGKSKFLELMLRQRLIDGRAFGLWDPHGDLAKSLLAFAAAQKAYGDDVLWRKIHYLELTPECIFSFDPVARAPLRCEVGDYAYYQWLRTRVVRVWKVLMRRVAEANQTIMVRLKRWLMCVLYACLVAIDDKNTHVGLDKALVFTDPKCREFEPLFEKVRAHLPPRIRRNFEKLIETKRAQDQEKWVESTINKLEEALSPLTEAVYSQAKPSIDIKGIIDRGEFLLIDLKETDYFSSEEKVVLGGLLLTEVLSVKQSEENVPEDERKEFMIVVDEVGELLGDDLKRALGATRKFKCPIVLGAQDLSTFAMGDFDMAAKVLTMCGTVVCFQNTYLEDKKFLADRVFSGNLDLFTKRMVEVQRQRGDRIIRLDEISENYGITANWGQTNTSTQSQTHAESIGNALAIANNYSDTQNSSEGRSKKEHGRHEDDVVSANNGKATVRGGATTATKNNGATDTTGSSSSVANVQGGGKSQGMSIAHKIMIQPNVVSEFEEDGTLEQGPVDVQRARHEQVIHILGVGQAAIAVRGIREAFVVQIMTVEEWWTDGGKKYEAIRRIKERLENLHPYYFQPSKRSLVGEQTSAPPRMIGQLNGKNGHMNGKPLPVHAAHTNGRIKIEDDPESPV